MRRRLFLSTLGVGALGAVLARQASAASQPTELVSYLTHVDETLLRSGPVAGPLRLRPAEGTRYDSAGLEVVNADNRAVGRLPPIHSSLLAPLVRAGRISAVNLLSGGSRPILQLMLI